MLSVMDLNLHLNRNRHVFRFWKYVFAFENAIISVVQTGVKYESLGVIFIIYFFCLSIKLLSNLSRYTLPMHLSLDAK